MQSLTFIIVAALLAQNAKGAADTNCVVPIVRGADYMGVVLPKPPGILSSWDADGTWTPTKDDVALFERALKKYMWRTPQACRQELKRWPFGICAARKELASTRRQYVGLTKGARRFLLANAFPGPTPDRRDPHPEWLSEWVSVWGGGPSYWRARFDFSSRSVEYVDINPPK
jgi:hypothetical protein